MEVTWELAVSFVVSVVVLLKLAAGVDVLFETMPIFASEAGEAPWS